MPVTDGGQVALGSHAHRRDIEGLRAIAVVLVLLYHLGVSGFAGGYVGVDVFFVVSGYLITNSLLSDARRESGLKLRNFYARRIRRLLPISGVVLISTAIASAFILEPGRIRDAGVDAISSGLFSSNWVFAGRATDYLQASLPPSPLQHYWSLSLEEQFYVVWPILLVFGLAIDRRLKRRLIVPITIVVIVIASFITSVVTTPDHTTWAYFGLHTRAWELGIGALIAVFLANGFVMNTKLAALLGAVALAVIGFSGSTFEPPINFPGWIAALPVLATAWLVIVGFTQRNVVSRFLGNPVFHFIGARSYSLYLWHWPVIILYEARIETSLNGWDRLIIVGITAVLTELGFRLVENPIRFNATLVRSALRTYGVGIASVALVVGCGAVVANYERDVSSGFDAEVIDVESEKTLEDRIEALRVAVRESTLPRPLPDNLTPSLSEVGSGWFSAELGDCFVKAPSIYVPLCEYGDPNGAVTVALFGDSHLAQWFDVLNEFAKENSIKLRSYMHAGCSLAGIVTFNGLAMQVEDWCPVWRDAVLDDLKLQPHDYVLMTNGFQLVDAETREVIAVDKWATGMAETIAAVTETGAVPIYFGDNPRPLPKLFQCLVNNVSDVSACYSSRPESTRSDFNIAGRQIVEGAGGLYIDLADYACSGNVCPAVIGNVLLYRDWSHLTGAGTELLAPVVTGILKEFIDQSRG